MRHRTDPDDHLPEIELVTLKVTQLDEENWRWELIGKRYLSKGRTEPVIRKADETGSKEYAIGPRAVIVSRLISSRCAAAYSSARLRQIEASKILRLPYVGDAGLCVDAKLPAMFPQKN
jgi:hypothetical protein